MRGARLLQCLLLLQNRGRMTSAALAEELEVSQRTILRDLDAMTEAGLPVIVHQGARGGIELGFEYRTKLTALTEDEAEAIGVMLAHPHPALAQIERMQAARRAAGKLIESQSKTIRNLIAKAQDQFELHHAPSADVDPRVTALARAVRHQNKVVLAHTSPTPLPIHPIRLEYAAGTRWVVHCAKTCATIAEDSWGDIAISAKTFDL